MDQTENKPARRQLLNGDRTIWAMVFVLCAISLIAFKRNGDALLNDFTMTFNDRETVQLSLQFQGTGALS